MKFEKFKIEGPILCKPHIITDERGFFSETYRKELLESFSKQKFVEIHINKLTHGFESKNILVESDSNST